VWGDEIEKTNAMSITYLVNMTKIIQTLILSCSSNADLSSRINFLISSALILSSSRLISAYVFGFYNMYHIKYCAEDSRKE